MARRAAVVGAIVGLALALAACGSSVAAPSHPSSTTGGTAAATSTAGHQIAGMLDLSDSASATNLDATGGCSGTGGFSDIDPGAQVTVTNQAGTIIGTGQLGPGTATGTGASNGYSPTDCLFQFTVTGPSGGGLPAATFYTFAIGHRAGVTFSAQQLAAQGWSVSLSLS